MHQEQTVAQQGRSQGSKSIDLSHLAPGWCFLLGKPRQQWGNKASLPWCAQESAAASKCTEQGEKDEEQMGGGQRQNTQHTLSYRIITLCALLSILYMSAEHLSHLTIFGCLFIIFFFLSVMYVHLSLKPMRKFYWLWSFQVFHHGKKGRTQPIKPWLSVSKEKTRKTMRLFFFQDQKNGLLDGKPTKRTVREKGTRQGTNSPPYDTA